MTRLLSLAVAQAEQLPEHVQDYLAKALLRAVSPAGEVEVLPAWEHRIVEEGLHSIETDGLASDADVAAAYRSFDR